MAEVSNAHPALQRFNYAFQENRRTFVNNTTLVEYGTNWFPFHKTKYVIFPESEIPLEFKHCPEVYVRFVECANAEGFVVLIPPLKENQMNSPFVATLGKVVASNDVRKLISFKAVYRCQVQQINQENKEALVKMLPEIEYPPIVPNILPRYAKFLSMNEQIGLASRSTGIPFDAAARVTRSNVEKCAAALKPIIGIQIVDDAIARGLTYFSYFAIRKLTVSKSIELELLQENSAEARIAAIAQHCERMIAKCKGCNSLIFRQENQLHVDDPTMTHINAHGYVHKITLLSEISNFQRTSRPSMEFTWFPGYSWVILNCATCGTHIGWEYSSEEQQPNLFYGVQREGVKLRCEREGQGEEQFEEGTGLPLEYTHANNFGEFIRHLFWGERGWVQNRPVTNEERAQSNEERAQSDEESTQSDDEHAQSDEERAQSDEERAQSDEEGVE